MVTCNTYSIHVAEYNRLKRELTATCDELDNIEHTPQSADNIARLERMRMMYEGLIVQKEHHLKGLRPP